MVRVQRVLPFVVISIPSYLEVRGRRVLQRTAMCHPDSMGHACRSRQSPSFVESLKNWSTMPGVGGI